VAHTGRASLARVRALLCAVSALAWPSVSSIAVAAPGVPGTDGLEPTLLVSDPEALRVVSESVGDFGALVLGADTLGANNATLAKHPLYRALMSVIEADVQKVVASDPQAGVAIRGHAHRLFDVRWLHASSARFELVAVASRLDRHFFNPEACGEVRLVYRLGYRQSEREVVLASRLPMTLAVELRADPADQPGACASAARRWFLPRGLKGRALGSQLVASAGPLSAAQITRARIVQVVSNVQTVRWPSAVRPALGGHAEYVLRAFAWDASRQTYRPRKLENTPDVARIARDPALRARLVSWLREPDKLTSIDGATVRLPDEFLAESVVSVTPRGLARRNNRPFRSLLEPSEFRGLDLSKLRFASSPEALVRRLDDLTCSGCHQARSIAGFHLLGDDRTDATPGNALYTGSSPHTLSELARRGAYTTALANQRPVDLSRPFAERATVGDDGYGAHCGLGDPGFHAWRCAPNLTCDAYEATAGESTVGVCLPSSAGTGDPCEPARVRADRDAKRDGVERASARPCAQVCEATRVGFPGGMCAASCSDLPNDAACGGIAILTPFNDCLARQRPFAECVRDHVRPAGLRACSDLLPCRDDYVCARTAQRGGVCLPPYFVFQMRVDGHPTPH
jgi:hypothetical protein